ncbi:MAG: 2-C-methyl-D-erythritol 4-phosphate cytidylyltransferase [Natronospirillum sp.]|uniref:2-C-methyl-D-erythritol 4-phosphate cytidylyltransferase n=1 Tax=Natronospirillum sp. TaxID=2812955 RepID=UPI0025E1A384|nr:2-C-methyl-D-erythritol 4-phosphate cytidylyltransferase [Natronospirillum sp.]MCH8551610.1 2-C-methyl-D-erythritol 4-phosphate cytidylyltransferase [Natronospirillum sp.]
MTTSGQSFWAIVPAAGVGRRMGLDQPKQFLQVAGKSILAHTLHRLARTPGLAGIVLVTADGTTHEDIEALAVPVAPVAGGAERADSVLAGLRHLMAAQGEDTWVLVHDAARPGVRPRDVSALMAWCVQHDEGAILALPARDTVKQTSAVVEVLDTLDRDTIWLAQTPQCFRAGPLASALQAGQDSGQVITDEASAMQAAGHRVGLVRGHWQNSKLTEPEDLELIEWILNRDE